MTALQAKILELLKEIDDICRANEINYYLIGGSLIGALRHKGFIPWDDDADIIMTRSHWEKFVSVTKNGVSSDIVIDSQNDATILNPLVDHTINHFVDISTTQIYRYNITRPIQAGVIIDILIMDPIPDKEDVKELYRQKVTDYSDLVVVPYYYSIRTGKPSNYLKNFKYYQAVGQKKALNKITSDVFKYTEDESQIYVQRFAGAPHFWPKNIFGKPKYVQFEDTVLPVPEHPERCLCIGYDDEWFCVPGSGVTRSQHDYCVCDLNMPGQVLGMDYSRRVDYDEMYKVYGKWKKFQSKYSMLKFNKTINNYRFSAERIRLIYKKKAEQTDYMALLAERNYAALEEYFDDYIKVQCTNVFLGSSALAGWINWYRKCHPYLIDIGDDALYAVLCLFVHNQKLAWFGKLLKARKGIGRALTNQISSMDSLYSAIKYIIEAYDDNDIEKCRNLVDMYLPKYPDNPFLMKYDFKLKISQGMDSSDIIKAVDKLLEQIPNDAELMYFKADTLLKNNEDKSGLDIFREIVEFTNHGIVLLNMKETVAAMFETKRNDKELAKLLLKIRARLGEEKLPNLNSIVLDFACMDEKTINSTESIASIYHNEIAKNEESTENNDDSENDGDKVSADERMQKLEAESLKNEYIQKTRLDELHQLTRIQQKRMELLCELKSICQRNGIRYFLFGKGLLQAARSKKFIDKNGDLTVVMTPINCNKFMQAVKEENCPNRFLDSMYDNPKFHRFCVRYGNTQTLDFSPTQCINPNCGIYITIEILRNPSTSKLSNLIDQMLEAGWETRNTMKWTSSKRKISYLSACILCFFLGEKGAARWLFKHFMMGPGKKAKGRYYLKPFWGKRTYFPAFWFSYIRNVKLEDIKFTTMKPYELYLKKTFGAQWKTRKYPVKTENQFSRIVDDTISSQEYIDHLKDNSINVEEVFKYRQLADKKNAPISTIGSQTSRYWDIMCMCGERHRLYEKYIPQKLYILELFRSNNIPKLTRVLNDYYKTALLYSKKGLGMLFDAKIFSILEYCLKTTGKGKQAAMLKRLHTAPDKEPIVLPNVKEGVGMRKATSQDLPAILVYLKRNLSDCLYMYIDIAKYGLENPNMTLWLNSNNNGITAVIMKYYSGISIQADDNYSDIDDILKIVNNENVTMIRGKKSIIEQIEPLCKDFKVEYGYVCKFCNFRPDDFDGIVESATPEDSLEIAKLVAADEDVGSYFDVLELANQFAERMNTKMGRSLVIRENNKIVAHVATYAEFEKIAVTSALVVSKESQNGIYGSVLEGRIIRQLWSDGFSVYTFVVKRLRKKFLEAMGNKILGEYGRLFREANKG